MKIKRNDDIIMVDDKLYQFHTTYGPGDQCVGCAFEHQTLRFCECVHCCDCNRIDKLNGQFKAI